MGQSTSASFVAIDLFAGCGGLSLGLKKAGLEVGAAVEINKNAILSYEHNIGKHVIEKDIREISGNEILTKANIKRGDLFLLAGCPPCQGFSSQRRNGGGKTDPRNTLVMEYIRLIIDTEPAFILMENVPGMARGFGKHIFNDALNKLQTKYHVVFGILNAADYGVPQLRKRLVLHGIKNDIFEKLVQRAIDFKLELPLPTHRDPKINDKTNSSILKDWNTARIIEGLPAIKAGEECKQEGIFNHKALKLSELNLARIRYIRENGGSRTCLPDELKLNCHKNVNFTDVYGIMDLDKPAPTITGGCLTYSKGRYGHPVQDRALSAREAARLQTFPDDFLFWGTMGEIALQIGNAVPVDLAKASGEYFKKLYKLINGK